jgi:tRNA dimethylallyltransferase
MHRQHPSYRAPVLGLCLAGPTASGKSALAMALAQRWPVDIINVDSALVYRGLDIGTAKPTLQDRAAVPHHLIDILAPTQTYSAAQFAQDASRIAADIRARGRLPLLVGGTMLYFKALRNGISAMPSAQPALRAQINAEATTKGWPALHAELALVDPSTAARLAPRDSQRIQRALEVWRSTGRALSAWQAAGHDAGGASTDTDTVTSTSTLVDQAQAALCWPMLSLEPASRAWLHQRIEQRFKAMLNDGFEAEVRQLRQRGDLDANLPSMRCVGYRQAWQALTTTEATEAAEATSEGAPRAAARGPQTPVWHDRALAATRQLAKHQLTWLRSVPSRTVLPCEAPDLHEQGVAWFAQWLQTAPPSSA